MMKQMLKIAGLMMLTLAASTSAQAAKSIGYWYDAAGDVAHNPNGECWRTIRWTPENALAECGDVADMDKDGVVDTADKCPGTAAGIMVDATGCAKDSDSDGVADSNDSCPGTASGIMVDATGCAKDSDGDGVADSMDQCAGTATGVRVDSNGCVMDSDHDGVSDSRDHCPGTMAGATVDNDGCAVTMDADGDGIADAHDQCPGTARGVAVNNRGCELEANIKLDNVQFKTGTAVLSAESRNILDHVADVLKKNPHLNFEVAGHTDSTGSYQANVNLSQQRANSVRDYLVSKGVAADRLTAQGYGPDKPVASNDTRQGRRMNRRVELMLK
jgi:outer membrane protein OmpA-like peptidoglycan-associated protein